MSRVDYNAIDVARYVVNYSWEIGAPISNLKLQKVLYLIQGNFLRILKKPCFKDQIEAWKYGPVIPTVYREFKSYGSNSIGKVEYFFELEQNKFEPIKKIFKFVPNTEEEEVIKDVVKACANFSSSYLVELTHKQSPWIKSYNKYDNIIYLDALKEYFCNE